MGQELQRLDIRLDTSDDLESIRRIHNYYVINSTITYDEMAWTSDDARGWFDGHGATGPVIVAEVDGAVVGFGAFGPFRSQSGYRYTVEHSIYIEPDHHRHGIGTALLTDLIRRAREAGFRVMVAVIDSEQEPSMALHAKFGFAKVGHLSQVGYKSGKSLDAVFMQLALR
jgi:phosphinothricin acetyltransferase